MKVKHDYDMLINICYIEGFLRDVSRSLKYYDAISNSCAKSMKMVPLILSGVIITIYY